VNRFIATPDLAAVFEGRARIPTVILWNRLEGRPRTHDFERALKAEIRDPLWMLAKQWQMGEFFGDDAGSPISAKVAIETTRLTKYQAASHQPEAFADDAPLEAKVGQRPLPFTIAGQPIALDIRIAMGKRWLKLIGGLEAGLVDKFVTAYGVAMPDPDDPAGAPVAAHRESLQSFSAFAGRAMDGYALYAHLVAAPGNHAHDGIALANPGNTVPIEAAEVAFRAWFDGLFYQPGGEEDAYLPERLEYAFSASAPLRAGGEMKVVAEQHLGGRVDWYSVDRGAGDDPPLGDVDGAVDPSSVEAKVLASFIPAPIRFDGMPNTRWWTFEEGRTNFGDIDPETTDVNKLLLMEFALVYANDWFLLPFTVKAGSIAKIRGMSVTNVFGERTWIEPAGSGSDEDWQRWSMFTLSTRGSDDVPADTSLLILPGAAKVQESEPVEAIQLTRDEMANMVWGIETAIALPNGEAKNGRRTAQETRSYFKRLVEAGPVPAPAPAIPNEAAIRYEVMTEIPENWIPFIPVHVTGSTRETQLRRAGLLRVIEGDPNAPVRVAPRTVLLRPGLDQMPRAGYDVHEEEVPRAGIRVRQSFQRTRWYDGEVFLWFGARKEAGRGEHSSGLAFDQIPPKPPS
jgi:hypothetical protein